MTGTQRDKAMAIAMETLVEEAGFALAGALGVVRLKLAAVRLMTDVGETEVVRDTERLESRASDWYSGAESFLPVAADAVRAFRDAIECGVLPPPENEADRIASLAGWISEVELELASGKAESCVKSYERDPVFMYLHRKAKSSAGGVFRKVDRWLATASRYETNAGHHHAALCYPESASRWLENAKAEMEALRTRSAINAVEADRAKTAAEAALNRARTTSNNVLSALLAAMDASLAEHAEIYDEASCLIARERAAMRVRAIVERKEQDPMPLEGQQEQSLAEFNEARKRYAEIADKFALSV